MISRALRPFLWLTLFSLLVGLSCSMAGSTPTAAVPTVESTPVELTTAAPTQALPTPEAPTPEPEAIKPGLITSRTDAEKGVIRIVAQGTFEDAEYGAYETAGSGTGFIIDPSGIAVTNNHVVTGAALLKVYFSGDDRAYNAKILGVSECSDLAVIDIEGDGYSYFEWYEDDITVGMDVWVAGFPLGDPEYTLYNGTIAKKQASGDVSWASVDYTFEHTANAVPGNSGGPVLSEDTKVIGIHYAGLSDPNRGVSQRFAITKQEASDVLESLIGGENVDTIGINGSAFATEYEDLSGIWVSSVASGSPADKSGIKPGDVIYQIEGVQLGRDGTMGDYCDILRTHSPEATMNLTIIRLKTGEWLEGQLNGRELTMTSTFSLEEEATETPGTAASLADDFSSDYGNWEIFDGATVSGGVFYLGEFSDCADVGSNSPFACFSQCLSCGYSSEYDMQVDAAYSDGVTERTFGMVLRFVDNNGNGVVDPDDYYLDFELSIWDKYFIVWEHNTDGKWYIIVQEFMSAIRPARNINTMRAIASNGGTDIDIYLNDEWVSGITSIPYTEGSVGLVVGGRAIQVAFDNFYIDIP